MLAKELREIAQKVKDNSLSERTKGLVRYVRVQAKEAAASGSFGLKYNLDENFPWTKEECLKAIPILEKEDGFKATLDSEISHWYSNTDWDDEEFFKITW